MRMRETHRWRWMLVGMMSVLSVWLLVELGSSGTAEAQVVQSAGDGRHVVVVAGQISPQTYGLYLVDYENRTICIYEYVDGARKLRLRASRSYSFDVRLDEYNTEPKPREIQRLVGDQKRLDETEH